MPEPTLVELIKDYVSGDTAYYEDVTITWRGAESDRRSGYLTVEYKVWNGGSMSYAGVHHPDDGVCVGEGVCVYCGCTGTRKHASFLRRACKSCQRMSVWSRPTRAY